MSVVLRPYQEQAIDKITTELESADTALCVLATGGGKTVIFAEIIRQMGVKTLVLAHRKELLDQAKNKILNVWPDADIGLVGYGQSCYGEHITVASVASLCSPHRRAQLGQENIRLLVIDECHHAMAESYLSVLETLQKDIKILGFTATPERLDKKDIRELFGEPVFEKTTVDLIRDGYLADIRTYVVRSKTTSLDGVGINGDYRTEALTKAIDRDDRNGIVVESYKEHANGLSAIVFAASVDHAQHLAEEFCKADIPASAIHGDMSTDEREDLLARYESGEIKVLTNVMLLTEGVDLPRTACIIMARPTKSVSLFKQCLGRGLRLYTDPITGESKSCCVFIDITDNYTLQKLRPVKIEEALDGAEVRNGLTLAEVQEAIAEERRRVEEERLRLEEEARLRALELEEEEAELERQRRKKYAEQQRTLTFMDSVLTKQIDLFGTQLKWECIGDRCYQLIVGEDTLYMQHTGNNLYQIYISFFNKVGKFPLFEKSINLVHAQNLCAKYTQMILEGKSSMLYPYAPWKSHPATEKHLQALRKCGITIPANCTKGEASELLDLYWSHPSRMNKSAKSKAS